MQELYLDLDEFKDGVIVFGQETFKIDRFVDASRGYFLQESQIGAQLINYFRGQAQLKLDISSKEHAKLLAKPGIPCSILSPDTDGWQSGKVRLKVQVTAEFYPDNPESFNFEEDPDQHEDGSPLDDIRSIES